MNVEGDDGGIRVCELANHNDEGYERLIERDVRRKDYQDFQAWSVGNLKKERWI